MADVEIPFGEKNKENAVLLLAAAKTLGREKFEVRTGQGKFVVDEEIAIEAGLIEKPKAEKKAPAKKAAKKSTAKKSSPKKSQE
jgi:hypothetical protein